MARNTVRNVRPKPDNRTIRICKKEWPSIRETPESGTQYVRLAPLAQLRRPTSRRLCRPQMHRPRTDSSMFVRQLLVQTGLGIGPMSIGGPRGYLQEFSSLVESQAHEVPQFHQLRHLMVFLLQCVQSVAQRNDLIRRHCDLNVSRLQGDPLSIPSMSLAPSAAGPFDKNASHGFCGGGKEMATTIPRVRFVAHEPEIRFMHQRRRLKGLARSFMGQLLGREKAEFLIDQRQEFVCSFRVPPFDGVQDARDVGRSGYLQSCLSIGLFCQKENALSSPDAQRNRYERHNLWTTHDPPRVSTGTSPRRRRPRRSRRPSRRTCPCPRSRLPSRRDRRVRGRAGRPC
jgi:hypothetical protein